MFNSKYNKILTIILIIAIIAIVAILIFVGINWYKAYSTETDIEDGLGQFDGYINSIKDKPTQDDNNTNTNTNTNQIENIEPDIDVDNTIQTANPSGGSSGSSGTTTKKPTYKGFNMVGKIEIPKTKLKCPVLEKVTPSSLNASVGVLYGPGINEVGNTVIIGHNWRNGSFFSNNKKLEIGDKVYLTDLQGKTVTYKITKKYTTDPDDFSYASRDTKGKREISLSTCTDDTKNRTIIWAVEE